MGGRGRLLLVVVGLALVATPAFVYPNGGLATYQYEVQEGPYVVANFASDGEYADCHVGLDDGACAVARYARDNDGIVVRDAVVDLPDAVMFPVDGVVEHYWMHTTETDEGTRITVEPVADVDRLYALVATPLQHVPPAARAALDGHPTTVSAADPPGDTAYLVKHEGEWRALSRNKVRSAGTPVWAEVLRVSAPPVGGLLLGLVAAGRRDG
jgi:hypothetical protein